MPNYYQLNPGIHQYNGGYGNGGNGFLGSIFKANQVVYGVNSLVRGVGQLAHNTGQSAGAVQGIGHNEQATYNRYRAADYGARASGNNAELGYRMSEDRLNAYYDNRQAGGNNQDHGNGSNYFAGGSSVYYQPVAPQLSRRDEKRLDKLDGVEQRLYDLKHDDIADDQQQTQIDNLENKAARLEKRIGKEEMAQVNGYSAAMSNIRANKAAGADLYKAMEEAQAATGADREQKLAVVVEKLKGITGDYGRIEFPPEMGNDGKPVVYFDRFKAMHDLNNRADGGLKFTDQELLKVVNPALAAAQQTAPVTNPPPVQNNGQDAGTNTPANNTPAEDVTALLASNGIAAKIYNGVKAPPIAANQVEVVQKMLSDAGYDLGKHGVDNKWGKDTQTAFLKACADKKIDPKTVDFTKGADDFVKALGAGQSQSNAASKTKDDQAVIPPTQLDEFKEQEQKVETAASPETNAPAPTRAVMPRRIEDSSAKNNYLEAMANVWNFAYDTHDPKEGNERFMKSMEVVLSRVPVDRNGSMIFTKDAQIDVRELVYFATHGDSLKTPELIKAESALLAAEGITKDKNGVYHDTKNNNTVIDVAVPLRMVKQEPETAASPETNAPAPLNASLMQEKAADKIIADPARYNTFLADVAGRMGFASNADVVKQYDANHNGKLDTREVVTAYGAAGCPEEFEKALREVKSAGVANANISGGQDVKDDPGLQNGGTKTQSKAAGVNP